MNDSSVWDLKLHESITILKGTCNVLRVPGGWIYTTTFQSNVINLTDGVRSEPTRSQVFVPFISQ